MHWQKYQSNSILGPVLFGFIWLVIDDFADVLVSASLCPGFAKVSERCAGTVTTVKYAVGVILDHNFQLDKQISSVNNSRFYHLRLLGQ